MVELAHDRRWRELLTQADEPALNAALLSYLTPRSGLFDRFGWASTQPQSMVVDLLRSGADPRPIWDDICRARAWLTDDHNPLEKGVFAREAELKALLQSAAAQRSLLEQKTWPKVIVHQKPVVDEFTDATRRFGQDALDPIAVNAFIAKLVGPLPGELQPLRSVKTASGSEVYGCDLSCYRESAARTLRGFLDASSTRSVIDLQCADSEGAGARRLVTDVANSAGGASGWLLTAETKEQSDWGDNVGKIHLTVWVGEEKALRDFLAEQINDTLADVMVGLEQQVRAEIRRCNEAVDAAAQYCPDLALQSHARLQKELDALAAHLKEPSSKAGAEQLPAHSSRVAGIRRPNP